MKVTAKFKMLALAAAMSALPTLAMAGVAADIKHPLWYKEPSAKTMELAKKDDLTGIVVSDGQRGEPGFPASELKLTQEQIDKALYEDENDMCSSARLRMNITMPNPSKVVEEPDMDVVVIDRD